MAKSMDRCGFAFLALCVFAFGPSVALAADAASGAELSKRWCASCHVVDAAQTRASADATAFRTIARAPGYERNRLTTFLLEPHGLMMPNMALTRHEVEDIVAHIESLAK